MKKSSIISLIVIAAAIGIIISMVSDSSTYETFASAKDGKEVHVVGFLSKEKPMEYNPEKNTDHFSFFLKDKSNEEKKVVFAGTKPQDFEKSEQIVLTGKLVNDEFHASKILMKCPSKYVNDSIQIVEAKKTSVLLQ